MKIIITTVAPNIESEVDPRFGRGAYLLVVDPVTFEWQSHPNPGVNAPSGAGIQAAQFVVEQKVGAVISGDFGPHAFQALKAANVPMYIYKSKGTVRDVIARFTAGQLQCVAAATRDDCHSEKAS